MDHFALPDDELAVASFKRQLHRNFMGYTTRPATDMLGVGVSAIGDVRGAFAQNHKKLPAYYDAIDHGRFPIERGYTLSHDDLVRRHVITELMYFHLDAAAVSSKFGIHFAEEFAPELAGLAAPNGPLTDGFVTIDELRHRHHAARTFVRSNICMAFDTYLPAHQSGRPVFSGPFEGQGMTTRDQSAFSCSTWAGRTTWPPSSPFSPACSPTADHRAARRIVPSTGDGAP
jgi:oxygen-independent coproporphyrinogen-3 oxidase